MENILLWIIIGSITGWIAKTYTPGPMSHGVTGDFMVGIVGALAGGYLSVALVGNVYDGFFRTVNSSGALLGAVALLSFVRILGSGRKSI